MSAVSNQLFVQPWGRAVGLLIGGAAFMVCALRGVGPLEIAFRTVTAGAVTALVVRGMIVLLAHGNRNDNDLTDDDFN